MIINILLTIIGVFVLVYLESIFWTLLGLRLSVLIFFLFFRKVEWKYFFLVSFIVFLVFDIVFKLPLGSNILIISLPFAVYLVILMFVSLDSGPLTFFIKTIIFWIYYILLHLLPDLFLSGKWGFFDLNMFLGSLLKAVLTVLIVVFLDYISLGFRKRGNTSQIRLK
jgi:hypothetical protein